MIVAMTGTGRKTGILARYDGAEPASSRLFYGVLEVLSGIAKVSLKFTKILTRCSATWRICSVRANDDRVGVLRNNHRDGFRRRWRTAAADTPSEDGDENKQTH
jgi:hypothetical protein